MASLLQSPSSEKSKEPLLIPGAEEPARGCSPGEKPLVAERTVGLACLALHGEKSEPSFPTSSRALRPTISGEMAWHEQRPQTKWWGVCSRSQLQHGLPVTSGGSLQGRAPCAHRSRLIRPGGEQQAGVGSHPARGPSLSIWMEEGGRWGAGGTSASRPVPANWRRKDHGEVVLLVLEEERQPPNPDYRSSCFKSRGCVPNLDNKEEILQGSMTQPAGQEDEPRPSQGLSEEIPALRASISTSFCHPASPPSGDRGLTAPGTAGRFIRP